MLVSGHLRLSEKMCCNVSDIVDDVVTTVDNADNEDDADGHLCRLAMRADVEEWGLSFPVP